MTDSPAHSPHSMPCCDLYPDCLHVVQASHKVPDEPIQRANGEPHTARQPDFNVVYYGIHDALRELGDSLADAGDGPGLDTPHVVSGLWDASSALSRIYEQLEALDLEVRSLCACIITLTHESPNPGAAEVVAHARRTLASFPASRRDG